MFKPAVEVQPVRYDGEIWHMARFWLDGSDLEEGKDKPTPAGVVMNRDKNAALYSALVALAEIARDHVQINFEPYDVDKLIEVVEGSKKDE